MKYILVDYSWFLHSSIFSRNAAIERKEKLMEVDPYKAQAMFIAPSTYTCLAALISVLKRVGLTEEDKVILCGDGRDSWRKEIEASYKSRRKETRDQAQHVNWDIEYENHNQLWEKIKENLFFYCIKLPRIEADDVIATATRYFKDQECIIVSPDKDFVQLLSYDHVKQFNPMSRPSIKTLPYKILSLDRAKEKEKAYKSLALKIKKEKTDDLVNEVLTEKDYDDRESVVSLLELPKEIEEQIFPYLKKVKEYEKTVFNIEAFSPGIQKKLETLFEIGSIITYEYCRKLFEKRLERKKSKKAKSKKANIKKEL